MFFKNILLQQNYNQSLHQKLKNQESANVAEPVNCAVPSVTSINNSSLELPTFDDIVKRYERDMKSSRVNHGRVFGFQIPPWIKEDLVVSSRITTALSFGDSLGTMARNALFTASPIWGTRTALHPHDSIIGNSALIPKRTICACEKTYFEKSINDSVKRSK